LLPQGKCVVELGGGCGLGGIAIAHACAAHVTITGALQSWRVHADGTHSRSPLHFIFALIMQNEAERMDLDRILWAVALVAVGASITRIIAYFFKIPGIPFVMNIKVPLKK
jgi:hypothetical protein